jgi:hypothetical protein
LRSSFKSGGGVKKKPNPGSVTKQP